MTNSRPSCTGEDLRDICGSADCPVCWIFRRDDETEEQWKARLRSAYEAAPFMTDEHKRGAA